MRISDVENISALTASASNTGALEVNHATTEAGGQDCGQSGGSDKVTLSEEGLRRAQENGDELSGSTDTYKKLIAAIKEKIERVEEEIEELEGSDMPPELKKQMIELKQKELAMYQAELVAAMQKKLDSL